MSLRKFWKSKQQQDTPSEPSTVSNHKVTAILDSENQIEIECLNQSFILDELLDNDIDVAYGCANGVCGKCKAKLIKGTVEEHEQIGLTKEEISQGYILVCKSCPTSDIQIQYDEA